MLSFIMINLFITFFHMSQGGVAWLYCSEVCIDAAMSFTSNGQFITLIIISFTFEYMINSSMGVHGSLWLFGIISLFGALFMLLFVRETRGKSDKEKKTLYTPLSKITLELQELEQDRDAAVSADESLKNATIEYDPSLNPMHNKKMQRSEQFRSFVTHK